MNTAADGNCKSCGSPLLRLKWNSVTDIIMCNNYTCRFFHTPVSNIAPRVSGVAKSEQESKIPEWLGGPNDSKGNNFSDIQVRLQRLWNNVHAEDEETEIP